MSDIFGSAFNTSGLRAQVPAVGPAQAVHGADVTLYKADDLTSPDKGPWSELAQADAIIFGAPTYMGSASAVFKQFMEAASKVWMAQGWRDKIAAGFTMCATAPDTRHPPNVTSPAFTF